VNDPFSHYGDCDVADLIRSFPLAFVSARGGGAEHVSLLPLLAELDATGKLESLLGHMPRRSPLHQAFGGDSRALILFLGPHGYISPEHAGKRNWAPTWNFAQLSIEAEVTLLPEQTAASVEALVKAMEQGRADPWEASELGARYEAMLPAIIAFRARVTAVSGRFKLGQDETPSAFQSIVDSVGDPALVRWMQRFRDRD
jgi:transcriptional regulator